jgi:hypothetical protein
MTQGRQSILAEMYAVSLLASFCINIGCLLIYRYFMGTKEIQDYSTSRTGTLVLELMLIACFVYLAAHRPYGTGLWSVTVTVLLAAGHPALAAVRPRGEGGAPQRLSHGDAARARGGGWSPRRLLPTPGELDIAHAASGRRFRHFLLAA